MMFVVMVADAGFCRAGLNSKVAVFTPSPLALPFRMTVVRIVSGLAAATLNVPRCTISPSSYALSTFAVPAADTLTLISLIVPGVVPTVWVKSGM